MADTLLALKAGRAFRREGTNFVDPSPTKGAILLANGDDGLFHFLWKNRATNQVEEDLILFPTDASFVKVEQSPSRVYVLKFSSSNQRHFFWLQDASPARDEEFVNNINGLLQDPEYTLTWNTSTAIDSEAPATSSAPAASASSSTSPPEAHPLGSFGATPEQLARLQSLIASMASNAPSAPELSLTDILTPENLNPLFTSHPELISTLFPHLPPDLPMPPSPEVLQRITNSPQFRAAVSNFDQALRTGLLGDLVRGLGLPADAGTSIEAFLRAIQNQSESQGEEGMDTN